MGECIDQDGCAATAEVHHDDPNSVSTEPVGDGDSTRVEHTGCLFRVDCVFASCAFAIGGSSASYYGTEV